MATHCSRQSPSSPLTGSQLSPSPAAARILTRVMMGSDYPWYDLDHTVERVLALPLLAEEEKHAILGANALAILGL